MGNNEIATVPLVALQAEQVKSERTTKRFIVALVIAFIMLVLSNAMWLYAWMQYDYTSEETSYSQDGDGVNNINNGTQGDVE